MAKKKAAEIDFEEDTGTIKITDEQIRHISKLAAQQLDIERQIEEREKQLDALAAAHRKISEEELPGAMQLAGVREFKLENGSQIKVEAGIDASITKGERGAKDNRPAAFAWLRANGYGDLIKNEVKILLGTKEDTKMGPLAKALEKLGLENFTSSTSVHAGTLKSFVKEQIEAGKPLPDSITVREYKRAVIKVS